MRQHVQAGMIGFLAFLGMAIHPVHALAADSLPAERAAAVDSAVQSEMKRQGLVGLAVGIIQQGAIVYTKGYGLADREKHVPVTRETVFNWASNSKGLTAVAAMQLVEKGKLNLDGDVRQYVPDFPDKGAVITMRHLLAHQSGLPHYDNEGKGTVVPTVRPGTRPALETPTIALDRFNRSPLLFKPGAKYNYSSYGYILASVAIERAGGEDFFKQIQERIAQPLGMKSLVLDIGESGENWAVGYEKSDGRVVLVKKAPEYWKYGAGGFKSNIEDFARWGEGLINGTLVSKKSQSTLWTPQKTVEPDEFMAPFLVMGMGDGLGFFIDDHEGELKISFDGGGEGVTTRLVIYPRARHGLVLMTNCDFLPWDADDFANMHIMSTRIYEALQEK